MTTDTYVVGASGKSSIVKDPQATLDYTFDWSAWLDLVDDTIADEECTCDDGIVIQNTNINGESVIVWLTGGEVGGEYTVTCKITTAAGRIDERSFYVKVRDR
jgi:hypothetical protein